MDKEFYCICCGAKGIDMGRGHARKYCSRECADFYKRTHRKTAVPKGPSCRYNDGVFCDKQACDGCGWNPAVEKSRKEILV